MKLGSNNKMDRFLNNLDEMLKVTEALEGSSAGYLRSQHQLQKQ